MGGAGEETQKLGETLMGEKWGAPGAEGRPKWEWGRGILMFQSSRLLLA